MKKDGLPADDPRMQQERRGSANHRDRTLGHVVACSGSRVSIAVMAGNDERNVSELWSVGRLISISVGTNRVVALVASMHTDKHGWDENAGNLFIAEAELLGEVFLDDTGKERFTSGISLYPHMGANAHRIRSTDLSRIYENDKGEACTIGRLTQDPTIEATIHVPSMLSKHFAVVGSTGVGKSTAVSHLLRKAVESDPKLRVLILDPHNEFSSAFHDKSVVIDTDKLDLPFWLFRLEEFAEVVFRGRPPVPTELDALRDLIAEAKKAFRGESAMMRRAAEKNSMTADTPVPYRLSDLLALIDDRIGRLDGRDEKPHLRSLKMRIMAAVNDPRYHFMFSTNTISDTINETIAHIFRIPGEGRPISTFQLAGIPSEVVNSVASVLCRMAFEIALWSHGAIHVLVVCEEAHRYVPADPNLGFLPTRQAISRIAKEGRKYGVSLGIITQRPGELDQTILSQCSTIFAMRLSNENDQEIIRKAIPNSSMSATNFISSIGNGEAIAFGEAIAVPMRLKFDRIAEKFVPKAAGLASGRIDDSPETIQLNEIVDRMRAISGPDISAFQQGLRRNDDKDERAVARSSAAYDAPHHEAPQAAPAMAVDDEEQLEPYNAAMLPRLDAHAVLQPQATPATLKQQAEALRAAHQAMAAEPAAPPAEAEPEPARNGPNTSLRDSLFKKQPGGLFRR